MEKGINEVTKDETIKTENEEATFETDSQAFNAEVGTGGSDSSDLQHKTLQIHLEKKFPDSDNFMKLYEESLKSIQEGEVIKGEIVQVGKEYVLVDIGYKSEGQIPIEEFIDPEGNMTAEVGDRG